MYKTIQTIGKLDSEIIAAYISLKCGTMSHLKLQKILFYVQAYHLAVFGIPLFDDDFEAWVHGPVIRKLFNKIRDFSLIYNEIQYKVSKGEPHPNNVLKENLTPYQILVINEVIDELKGLSGLQLEAMTHSEPPWRDARLNVAPGDRSSNIISKDAMMKFYTQKYCEKK